MVGRIFGIFASLLVRWRGIFGERVVWRSKAESLGSKKRPDDEGKEKLKGLGDDKWVERRRTVFEVRWFTNDPVLRKPSGGVSTWIKRRLAFKLTSK